MNIKVNGVNISVENGNININTISKDSVIADIENQANALSRESEDLSKQIRAIKILSNVKAVESFGYKSTEGVGQTIANATKVAKDKIIAFFKKIGEFFVRLVNIIKEKLIPIRLKNCKLSDANKKLLSDNLNIATTALSEAKKGTDIYIKSGNTENEDVIVKAKNACTQTMNYAKKFISLVSVIISASNTTAIETAFDDLEHVNLALSLADANETHNASVVSAITKLAPIVKNIEPAKVEAVSLAKKETVKVKAEAVKEPKADNTATNATTIN